jgi:5'-nucleotidase
VLGVPAIAVSQQADHGAMDFRIGRAWEPENFEAVATFVARIVEEVADVPMPTGTLLNVNAPAGEIKGVSACRLGKRIYRDTLELAEEDATRRRYRIYGESPGYHPEEGTDFAAIADGRIALTPLHFDLTDRAAIDELASYDLDRLLVPAAREA